MAADFELEGFDHVAITVRDVERSIAWYVDVLGLERRFEDDWGSYPAVVCAGDACLAIFPVEGEGRAPAGNDTIGMRHFAFRVDRANFEQVQEVFRRRGIDFSFSDHGVSHSVYISDPDGHRIEITTYEV